MPKGLPSHPPRKDDATADATDAAAHGPDSVGQRDSPHGDAVRDRAGRHPGLCATRYLEDLRRDWPE